MDTRYTPKVTVPADARYGHTLGLVAVGLAADLGFDADRIDDLDFAIEEATETLASLADAGEISLVVHEEGSVLRCVLTATGTEAEIELDDLRNRVFTAVTDGLVVSNHPPAVTLLLARRD